MDDASYFFARTPGKTIVGSRFMRANQPMRIASQVMDATEGVAFHTINDQVVLRITPSKRQSIKAVFLEDSREIKSLTIQRFTDDDFPVEQHFTFVGEEIRTLTEFLAGISSLLLEYPGKRHISASELRDLLLTEVSAQQIFRDNEALFLEVAENSDLTRDLIALGYRRAQLARFEKLLTQPAYFEQERSSLGPSKRPEDVWQAFFEANPWVFGYGLSFQFATSLDNRTLEQVVQGSRTGGLPGKRVDALMKTRARINSLCFVEIKRHDTPLLATKPYRSGAYSPSGEVVGGVAQIQTTVQAAIDDIGKRLQVVDKQGNPTGEDLFNLDPRAYLVVGNLAEFHTDWGPNEDKFRSFELFRRNMRRPEIITFDELYQRAQFIVGYDADNADPTDDDDDVPF